MKRRQRAFRHGGVWLRPLTAADIELTRVWRNRDEVRRWFKDSAVITADQQRYWFDAYRKQSDDFVWLVEDAARPGEVVGQASVYAIDWDAKKAEIGRFIAAPRARGMGNMIAACRAVIHYCFVELDLDMLMLDVFIENVIALHIYRKCGFMSLTQEGGVVGMVLTRQAWSEQREETDAI
ncbi:GCN5-related N-acetyltransferase [Gammaproteobacteria bacterium]